MHDPAAAARFEEIYNSTYKAVLTYITSKSRRTADVADIFQDTYMELYQVISKRGADYVENDKAFVLRLAKQKLARYYSLLTRLSIFVSLRTVSEEGEGADLIGYEAAAFATEDFAVNQATLISAKEFIESQPEVVQKIFYLHYELDLKLGEIAQALGIKESTIKSKLYRSLKELREVLA